MSIFKGWENHTEKIKANWNRLVADNDTVVLPGDLSWALKPNDAIEDLKFLNSLNGKKIIGKGNHDLWWGTKAKLTELFNQHAIDTVDILFNNAFLVDGISICGSRGWFFEETQADKKVILREAGRLETSIKAGIELGGTPIVFLHYPPVYSEFVCEEIFEVLKKYGIEKVYHGHIHGLGFNKSVSEYGGIQFKLVSCDCVDFTPVAVK